MITYRDGHYRSSWDNEPIRIGPQELESETYKLGDVPVRLTWYRGKLAGVESWRSGAGSAYLYDPIIDPERPWLK